MRNNAHVDRDPEIKLKFADGGKAYLDEISDQAKGPLESPIIKHFMEEEEKTSADSQVDIISRIIQIFSKGKNKTKVKSRSPFSN